MDWMDVHRMFIESSCKKSSSKGCAFEIQRRIQILVEQLSAVNYFR